MYSYFLHYKHYMGLSLMMGLMPLLGYQVSSAAIEELSIKIKQQDATISALQERLINLRKEILKTWKHLPEYRNILPSELECILQQEVEKIINLIGEEEVSEFCNASLENDRQHFYNFSLALLVFYTYEKIKAIERLWNMLGEFEKLHKPVSRK